MYSICDIRRKLPYWRATHQTLVDTVTDIDDYIRMERRYSTEYHKDMDTIICAVHVPTCAEWVYMDAYDMLAGGLLIKKEDFRNEN